MCCFVAATSGLLFRLCAIVCARWYLAWSAIPWRKFHNVLIVVAFRPSLLLIRPFLVPVYRPACPVPSARLSASGATK